MPWLPMLAAVCQRPKRCRYAQLQCWEAQAGRRGDGQVLLGWATTVLGCFVLWGWKWREGFMAAAQYPRLAVIIDEAGPSESEIHECLTDGAIEIRKVSLAVEGPRAPTP